MSLSDIFLIYFVIAIFRKNNFKRIISKGRDGMLLERIEMGCVE